MTERQPVLSRRDFNKMGALTLLAAATLPIGYQLQKEHYINLLEQDPDMSFLDEANYFQELPPGLSGIHYNFPHPLKRSKEQLNNFFNAARETTGQQAHTDELVNSGKQHTMRIMPDYAGSFIEPVLGEFNFGYLDKMGEFFDELPEDFQVILPILDGYWIFRSDIANPMYSKHLLIFHILPTLPVKKKNIYPRLVFLKMKNIKMHTKSVQISL